MEKGVEISFIGKFGIIVVWLLLDEKRLCRWETANLEMLYKYGERCSLDRSWNW